VRRPAAEPEDRTVPDDFNMETALDAEPVLGVNSVLQGPPEPVEELGEKLLSALVGSRPEVAIILTLKSDVDASIRELRTWHRTVCDGITLATEQVQDKRMDWLEEGPQVQADELLIDFALAFFLDSPAFAKLLRDGLKRAFSYVADRKVARRLAGRTAAFQAIDSAEAKRIAAEVAPALAGVEELTTQINRLREEAAQWRALSRLSMFQANRVELTRRVRATRERVADLEWDRAAQTTSADAVLAKILDESAKGREQVDKKLPDLKPADLLAWLKEREPLIDELKEYGRSAAKAGRPVATAAARSPDPESEKAIRTDGSVGVLIRGLAYESLRAEENILSAWHDTAALAVAIALADSKQAVQALTVLATIRARLAAFGVTTKDLSSFRSTVAWSFELLIWALLMADSYEIGKPFEIPVGDEPAEREGSIFDTNADQSDSSRYHVATGPVGPPIDYWRARFYEGKSRSELTDGELIEQLKNIKKTFDEFVRQHNGPVNPLELMTEVVPRKRTDSVEN